MYLDSCILVKLLIREPDSEFYGQWVDGHPVSSSLLAYTEVWSALLARERAQLIGTRLRLEAWQRFEDQMRSFGELIGFWVACTRRCPCDLSMPCIWRPPISSKTGLW
jgi:predicted nucleic acid-binding protein